MTDLPTPNTTQPYILQQYDRSSNTEHNTTVYIVTIWPILCSPNTTQPYILQQYDRSSNTERSQPYILQQYDRSVQHRTQHNRIYCNNMTDLFGVGRRSYCRNIYGCVVFGVGTSVTLLYYNNMTDLPTPNTTQPYILQQYDRSSNTEHNTTVYIATIWPIFVHRVGTRSQPYILQQYDRSCNTEHNTTVYITTIWPYWYIRLCCVRCWKIGHIVVIYTVVLCSVLEDRSCCNIYGCVVLCVGRSVILL